MPSLYYAEGLPYVVVMIVSVIMYKRLGISNADIALYTSWLYLPWVIKPLWSPVVDILRTRRFWIVTMQLVIGAGLAGVALTLNAPDAFRWSLAVLWLLAFSSATHDIAADGFYMMGLSQHDQAWFVGIRSTFYRGAMITGQGLLVILAGYLETSTGLNPVEFRISADPQAVVAAPMPLNLPGSPPAAGPDSLGLPPAAAVLSFDPIAGPATVSTAPVDPEWADSLIAFARDWNVRNGYVEAPDSAAAAAAAAEGSWWTRSVSGPLGRFIQSNFGQERGAEAAARRAGNVALVPITLRGENDEPIVFNLTHEDGDPSVRLVHGERLVFGAGAGVRTALAVIQLDPKLSGATEAVFVGRSGNIPLAWSITFLVLAGLFVLFFAWHRYALPHPAEDRPAAAQAIGDVLREFVATFADFFRRPGIGVILSFLLFYRFAEAQLLKLASPFLLDTREAGGLALTTGEVGFVYGTVGILALTLGGITGGLLAARDGLKHWLWVMVCAINLPNLAYIWLAYATPESLWMVNAAVAVEQFGYGFGFTAYMLYMIYVADGAHKTAHYAICTGFMALGMMIPGMFSGWLEELLGYRNFFVWVVIATIPGFIVAKLIPLDPAFGRKEPAAQ